MAQFYPSLQLATIFLWIVTSIFLGSVAGKRFFNSRFLSFYTFFGALLQFIVAAFLFYKRQFDGVQAENFAFSTNYFRDIAALSLSWDFSGSSILLWIVFSALGVIFFLPKKKLGSQLDPVLLWAPLTYLGVCIGLLGKDLITIYFGWSLVGAAQFLSLAFFNSTKSSRFSSRFQVLSLLGEIFFLGGLVCFAAVAGTVDVSAIKTMPEKMSVLFLPASLIGFGLMMRACVAPMAQMNWLAVSAGRSSSLYTVLAKSALITGAVIQIFPIFQVSMELRYLAFLPMLSCIFTAVCMLVPRSGELFASLATSYSMAIVFLLAWLGSAQGALLAGLSAMITVFGFYVSQSRLETSSAARRPLLWFFAFALLGLPFTLMGWAKFMTLKSLVVVPDGGATSEWILFAGVLLAEMIFGMAIWTVVRRMSFEKDEQSETNWIEYALVCLVALASLSVALGGRPLGILGGYSFSPLENWSWLTTLVDTLPGIAVIGGTAELVDNSEVLVRAFAAAAFLIPILLAHFWFGSDRESNEALGAGLAKILGRSVSYDEERGIVYTLILKPFGRWIAIGARWFEQVVNEDLVPRIFAFPRTGFKYFSGLVEDILLDRFVVDGSWNVLRNLSRAVKLAHVGRVQFYLVVGIVTLVALAMRLKGG